jgi:hypothetical protein
MNIKTFTVQAIGTEQEDILKAYFNALKIKLEMSGEVPYNKDFADMILQAEDGIQKGEKVSSEKFHNRWK